MMTLLARLAKGMTKQTENLVTEGLYHILDNSENAQKALEEMISETDRWNHQ